jgi:hypothetical protein
MADLKNSVNTYDFLKKNDISIPISANKNEKSQKITLDHLSSLVTPPLNLVPPPLKRAPMPKLEFDIESLMILAGHHMKPNKSRLVFPKKLMVSD